MWTQMAHSVRLHRLISRILSSQTEARASAWAQARQAIAAHTDRVDIDLRVPDGAAEASRELLEPLEEADELCTKGELLTLPAADEIRDMRR
jgi:hypothetical protein